MIKDYHVLLLFLIFSLLLIAFLTVSIFMDFLIIDIPLTYRWILAHYGLEQSQDIFVDVEDIY